MNIKMLKLLSGEEIIAEVEEQDDVVILKHPIQFTAVPTEDGGQSMGAVQWPSLGKVGDEGIPMSRNHIVCMLPPIDQVYKLYDSQYGSGLITPTSSLIV